MVTTNRPALAALLGVGAILTAQAQAPAAANPTPEPGAASSPHQRSVTGQDPDEATAASSRHQGSAKGSGAGEKMAADRDGVDPGSFVKKAAQGGMTEVALSKAAATKSQDAKVRKFASQMVADHEKANDQLASVANKKGFAVPTSLDAEHQAVVQKINNRSGADFDAAYSKQMMSDHEKTVALFEAATKSTDADLAAFAKQTLPILKEHKHMASQLPEGMRAANSGESMPQGK
jgi:putative membrane protein